MTSKRDEVEDQMSLRALLSCTCREEYDDAAVQSLLERNPGAALGNDRILFSALECGASTKTIRLICDANPRAVRGDHISNGGRTPLHAACKLGVSLEIVRLLYELWPEAVKTKGGDWCLPLHDACFILSGPSLDVVKFLVEVYPEALKTKNASGNTPLAVTCHCRPSEDLLNFLVEKYPNAVRESSTTGLLPLHVACHCGASKKAVALLADKYPEALRSKTRPLQYTPLHSACSPTGGVIMPDVVKLLIERCPDAVMETDYIGRIPLNFAKGASPQVVEILSSLQLLAGSSTEQKIMRTLDLFHDIEWPGGVALVLDKFPAVVNNLDQSLMPRVLSMVGRRCSIDTFYSMFLENPALAKGAVKRENPVGAPPAKKARSK